MHNYIGNNRPTILEIKENSVTKLPSFFSEPNSEPLNFISLGTDL